MYIRRCCRMDTEQTDAIDIGVVTEQLSENFSNHVSLANPVVPEQEGALESNNSKEKEPKDGECYIFDYQEFTDLPPRIGSEKDALRLKHDFTQLNLNVHLHENLLYRQTFDVLKTASKKDHSKNKYFICCFLTHGNEDYMWTKDKTMSITDILDIFSELPSLKGIPKIFIIEACRGTTAELAVSTDSTDGSSFVPEDHLEVDFLIVNSTYLDTVSFKTWNEESDKIHGSFFIDEFCRSLEQFSKNMGLLNILTIVNSRMAFFLSHHPKNSELDRKKQMSCFTSTLRKEVKFNRSIDIFDSIDTQYFDKRRKKHWSGPDSTNAPLTDTKYEIMAEKVLFLSIKDKSIGKQDRLVRSAVELWSAFACRNYSCIELPNDFKKEKILKFLDQNSKQSEVDCLICYIAAYSRYNCVCDAFGKTISRKDIVEKFIGQMNKSFIGKPKIFIFLLCKCPENKKFLKERYSKEVESSVESSRNTNYRSRRSDVQTESTDSRCIGENLIPRHADILEICLTVSDWELVIEPMELFEEILNRSPKEDLVSLLTEFNSQLVEKCKFFQDKEYFSMTSTLTKYLHLP